MEKIHEGLLKFKKTVFEDKKELFQSLSKKQSPRCLFITCSDSRIDPSLITQTDPGDLFILRNAGNIVPTYGSPIGGVTATIEYAVAVLEVEEIIVCGHTDCGAMQALLHPQKLEKLPAVKTWLQQAETTIRIVQEHYAHLSANELFSATIKENVLVQLDHLRTHPSVATRLRHHDVRLHGWVYSIPTGEVWTYNFEKKKFLALSSAEQK